MNLQIAEPLAVVRGAVISAISPYRMQRQSWKRGCAFSEISPCLSQLPNSPICTREVCQLWAAQNYDAKAHITNAKTGHVEHDQDFVNGVAEQAAN